MLTLTGICVWSLLAFVVVPLGRAASPQPDPKPGLAGTWEVKIPELNSTLVLVLEPDGAGQLDGENIRYSIAQNRLSIIQDGETQQYLFALQGDRLTLSGGDLERPTTFVRKSSGKGLGARLNAAPSPSEAPPPATSGVAGSWELRKEGRSLGFQFQPEGSGTLNGLPLTWRFEGGTLSISMGGNTVAYEAAVSAKELRLSGGDLLEPVTLQRAAGPKAADARIVGRWKSSNGAVIEFKADGAGANRRGAFRYTAMDGTLVITEGPLIVSYEITGTELILSAHGESVRFERTDAAVETAATKTSAARNVVVNKTRLAEEDLSRIERQFQVRTLDGSYWYDKVSGAWGVEGGPTVGWLPPNLDLGGQLRADASGGGTGVFINGRELHPLDVRALSQITQVVPGRYWVNAQGLCGFEGNPTPLVDLAALARNARSRGGGGSFWRNDLTGMGGGSDGRTSYVMGKDFSVIVGD